MYVTYIRNVVIILVSVVEDNSDQSIAEGNNNDPFREEGLNNDPFREGGLAINIAAGRQRNSVGSRGSTYLINKRLSSITPRPLPGVVVSEDENDMQLNTTAWSSCSTEASADSALIDSVAIAS